MKACFSNPSNPLISSCCFFFSCTALSLVLCVVLTPTHSLQCVYNKWPFTYSRFYKTHWCEPERVSPRTVADKTQKPGRYIKRRRHLLCVWRELWSGTSHPAVVNYAAQWGGGEDCRQRRAHRDRCQLCNAAFTTCNERELITASHFTHWPSAGLFLLCFCLALV